MIIKGKPCIVFDVEVLKNIITVTCKNTENNLIVVFEISERKVDIEQLIEYFKQDVYFVGYNSLHYDNPIINYIIYLYNRGFFNSKSTYDITCSIFRLSQTIINSDDISSWKTFKYAKNFKGIDLLAMLYSKQLRVSLKEMQVTMHYKNVEEFIVDWHQDLNIKYFDKLIAYNINDVESTTELLNRCDKALKLRVEIEKEYGIDCLNLDGVNLGMKILELTYIKATGIQKDILESLRSPCDVIDLEKVILPIVNFKSKTLQSVLADMKSQHHISPSRKGYINTFIFGGMKVTIGVGGIHGDCGTCIIKPDEDELLVDEDVTSLYPSMIIEHCFYPPHLGKVFVEIYSKIKDERIEAKKNKNKVKNETLKFALNGLSGNLQSEHSWVYSPFTVMQIRINGQLLLLMLAERLLEIGCKLKQINTDGILFIVKKDKLEEYKAICKQWEIETKLCLESEYFDAFYQLKINDYFGVTPEYNQTKDFDNDIKKKGKFITTVLPGKGLSPKIIPEAVIKYFTENIPIEETLKNCNDIRKFLMSEKTGKQWNVEYKDEPQQRTNRFYVGNKGFYLWKWKEDDCGKKQYNNMLAGYGVVLCNKLDDLSVKDKDINYAYYIVECKKLIEQLKPRQLSLF